MSQSEVARLKSVGCFSDLDDDRDDRALETEPCDMMKRQPQEKCIRC